jgi:hypothetical protein
MEHSRRFPIMGKDVSEYPANLNLILRLRCTYGTLAFSCKYPIEVSHECYPADPMGDTRCRRSLVQPDQLSG